MSPDELFGKYMRLRRELADAYTAPRWRGELISRLADDIIEVERAMADAQPRDEQTSEGLPHMSPVPLRECRTD